MKTLYIDCSMGAAGDMLAAALSELVPDKDGFISELSGIGLPEVKIALSRSEKCGIVGTAFSVTVGGEEENEHMHEHSHSHTHDYTHRGLHETEHIISELNLSDKIKKDIKAVYRLIAEAESSVHGTAIENIHFHEVGTMDAITDITAVCMLMDKIGAEKIIASPVHVGSGHVRCAHGILPVPAPATVYLLRGVPIYSGSIKSELCTPTGAALLKYFVGAFADMPAMSVSTIGYGMGKKDFETANCVRVMLGDTEDCGDIITELCCNIDDMTAEELGFASERLFCGGALDVYTVPAYMKKNRPAHELHIICKPRDKDSVLSLLFKHTKTLGVREYTAKRHVMSRSVHEIQTEYGKIREKISSGFGVTRAKYEYDDIAKIASENSLTLDEIKTLADKAKEKN